MELFQAGNDDQWTYIKRRIDDCDYYFLILAERYGSVNSEGVSYTEMEYKYALKKNIPIAAFILNNNMRADWPNAKVEKKNYEKLENFRTLVSKKIAKFWSNKYELGSLITNAIRDLEQHHPRFGWVKADRLPNPNLLNNYDRIVEENRDLREKIDKYKTSENDYSYQIQILSNLTFKNVIKSYRLNPNSYEYEKRIVMIAAYIENGEDYSCIDFLKDNRVNLLNIMHRLEFPRKIDKKLREVTNTPFGLSISDIEITVQINERGKIYEIIADEFIAQLTEFDILKHETRSLEKGHALVYSITDFGKKFLQSLTKLQT